MSYRVFLIFTFIATLLAWVSLGLIVVNFDPAQIGFFIFLLFYLCLFLSLSGTFFLIIDSLKNKFNPKQLFYERIRISLRHALFFTVLITLWLFLKGSSLLRWWNLLMLIAILAVLEFFFISFQKEKHYNLTYEGSNKPNSESI